jgi:hypothetical protein
MGLAIFLCSASQPCRPLAPPPRPLPAPACPLPQPHRCLGAVPAAGLYGGNAHVPSRRILGPRRRDGRRRHALHHPCVDDGPPAAAPG